MIYRSPSLGRAGLTTSKAEQNTLLASIQRFILATGRVEDAARYKPRGLRNSRLSCVL